MLYGAAHVVVSVMIGITQQQTIAPPDGNRTDVSIPLAVPRLQNVSSIIRSLLAEYDIRLRPSFGGKPLLIGMDIVVASFDSISEVNMDYTITLYLNQYWRDDRLAYARPDEKMTLTGDFADKIWVPDTFFANDKKSFLHDVTEQNKMVRLYGDGSVAYGMRFTTTLACMMDLHNYPLDVQNCTVEIESYGYPMQDVIMYWRSGKDSVKGVDSLQLPQFKIVSYDTISRVQTLTTGSYQRLSLSFKLQRSIGYFIFQTYLPCILIVMLSWVSFWINHEATSARVALGITTVLTMTTISTGVRSSLPRISYIKAIDIYLVMCFVFVFAALLEYAAVNYTYWGARAKRKAKQKQNRSGDRNGNNYTKQETPREVRDRGASDESTAGRASPLPILMNRPADCTFESETVSRSPSLAAACPVTTPPPPRTAYQVRYSVRSGSTNLRKRTVNSSSTTGRRKSVLTHLKKKASQIKHKLPGVEDVNKIDKYSRLVFPSLFTLFNVCYWCFYLFYW